MREHIHGLRDVTGRPDEGHPTSWSRKRQASEIRIAARYAG
jgi:hypothetical protein